MHKSIIKMGLFLGVLLILSGVQKAEALTVDQLMAANYNIATDTTSTEYTDKPDKTNQKENQETNNTNISQTEQSSGVVLAASTEVTPTVHPVESGQSLSTIASQYQTTWKRLYDKNTHIADPNIIKVGDSITVPALDEQLATRDLPIVQAIATPVVSASTKQPKPTAGSAPKPKAAASSAPRGSSSGNLYSVGYCTWYVKNRRPDLPNNLGNANTWVSRARAQGLPTGSSPRVGAVGQKGMHVVYVESINAGGTVTISEMNREGWNVKSSRTVPASYFQYIY